MDSARAFVEQMRTSGDEDDARDLGMKTRQAGLQDLADAEKESQALTREYIDVNKEVTSAARFGSSAMRRAQINAQAELDKRAIEDLQTYNGAAKGRDGAPLSIAEIRGNLTAIEDRRKSQLARLDSDEEKDFAIEKKGRQDNARLIEIERAALGKSNIERAREVEYQRAMIELREKYASKAPAEIEAMAKLRADSAATRAEIDDATRSSAQYALVIATNVERAIVNFNSLKDVASAFARDMQTVILRQTVTMPLQQAITGQLAQTGITAASSNMFNTAFNWIGDGVRSFFAEGGVMTSSGPVALPVHTYATGGVANKPQLAIFGEGRTPEAYVPLEDGKNVPLTVRRKRGSDDDIEAFVRLPGGRVIPTTIKVEGDLKKDKPTVAAFADGGIMTSAGPKAASLDRLIAEDRGAKVQFSPSRPAAERSTPGSPGSPLSTKFENNITVNVDGGGGGGGGQSNVDGDAIGKRVSAEVTRMLRGLVSDEMRRQMRPGAMMNPGI